MALLIVVEALLGCEQAWTPNIYLKSFDMDSVQVGKAVFVKGSYTTLGIEPRTASYPGRLATILVSVGLKKYKDIDMILLDVIIDHNFGSKEYHGVLF